MKIGLVGYQGCGKSTLFEWLTGAETNPSLSHTTQSAMAEVPDERIERLCEIYHPKKVTRAALEIVDTPGLSKAGHEGNANRLSLIREAGCLVFVVPAFDGSSAEENLRRFEEDLILADLEIVTGRIARLDEQIKKPRPDRDQLKAEQEALRPMAEVLESGRSLRDMELTDEQRKLGRGFQLFSHKPRLVIVNTADDEEHPERFEKTLPDGTRVLAVPVGLERELGRMTPEERDDFRQEMGLEGYDRGALIRTLMDVSGQMLFFTAGEKEVRTWMIPQQCSAVDAADSIHSDMARGFIRAEVFTCADLFHHGSERELKAHNLIRKEPKDYIIHDGDVLFIHFSV